MFNHLSKRIHTWQCTCASDLGMNSIRANTILKHNPSFVVAGRKLM